MSKALLFSVFLLCATFVVKGQETFTVKGDSLKRDTVKSDTVKYVNLGKIAARKAAIRSAIIPGWGQVSNGLTVYRGIKVAAIYTGGTLLAMSFIQNTNNYRKFLAEIQFRERNNDEPTRGGELSGIPTSGLITNKDIFRRNREVIIFSFAALYAVNIIEAYVDARLKYFDVGNDLGIKLSPSMINTNMRYGYNSFSPALKLGLKF